MGPQLVAATQAATAAGVARGSVPTVPEVLLATPGRDGAVAVEAEGAAAAAPDEGSAENGNGPFAAADGEQAGSNFLRQRMSEVMNNVIHGNGVRR